MAAQTLILASGSPRRVELLAQVGITPGRLMPMDLDETPKRAEHPRSLAWRLSAAKAQAARHDIGDDPAFAGSYILAADTVVSVGRRILPKPETASEASDALHLLSGRNHHVHTGIALVTPQGRLRQKIVETKVRFKRLSEIEISRYLASGEWRGKAGAYAIQGIAGSFVVKLVGSYTNVVGLPLSDATALLQGEGFDVGAGWQDL
ncbi:Maf-like protein [Ensifer soli]|uniref:Maf-like protein n=1 Tax=Ciceribacter sp. sgz301302 TaxID=3342379 RepID=UPI0035B8662D